LDPEANEAGSQPAGEATPPEGAAAGTPPAAGTETDPNVTANGEKLDRQTRNWRALERDRDHWREMAMRQQPQGQQTQQQTSQRQQAEPERDTGGQVKTLADFDFDEAKYQQYLIERVERHAETAVERRLREQGEAESARRRQSQFQQRSQAFAKENPDYGAAVERVGVAISQDVAQEILDSEEGPAITLYLDNNPDVMARLNGLSAREVAREIVRLEVKVQGEREKAKAARSSAGTPPPPTPKIEGAGDGAGQSVKPDSPDSDQLSDAEWARRRNAQLKARSARK
jgi:hypothetical protein